MLLHCLYLLSTESFEVQDCFSRDLSKYSSSLLTLYMTSLTTQLLLQLFNTQLEFYKYGEMLLRERSNLCSTLIPSTDLIQLVGSAKVRTYCEQLKVQVSVVKYANAQSGKENQFLKDKSCILQKTFTAVLNLQSVVTQTDFLKQVVLSA